ncbi:MAG TPA: hypothetical protein VFT67_16430 [Jatrophihabitantaceae bacterium]|nr:hypothetical protein [Jatrophihabitantaceae bacterium]
MTWDESELRAALHEGEGETLSPGHIVALGEARLQRRHDRIRTAAVAVVVTGLLGGGVGALTQLGGSSESASSNSAAGAKLDHFGGDRAAGGSSGSAGSSAGAAGGNASYGSAPQPLAPAAGAEKVCPAHPAAITLPTDEAANTTAPLFTGKVTSIRLCGYRGKPDGVQTLRAVTTLRGAKAQELADDVNASPAGVRAISCPAPRYSRSVVLYPVSGTTPGTTVRLYATCGIDVTDGHAERLIWNPPADLRSVLDDLTK